MATLINVSQRRSCTATIFSPLWLVTSYSCVQAANITSQEWVVMAGITEGDSLADKKTQIRSVREVLPYQGQHLTSPNIALVHLDQPLVLGHRVQAVCLATQNIQNNKTCVSVGGFHTETGLFY